MNHIKAKQQDQEVQAAFERWWSGQSVRTNDGKNTSLKECALGVWIDAIAWQRTRAMSQLPSVLSVSVVQNPNQK